MMAATCHVVVSLPLVDHQIERMCYRSRARLCMREVGMGSVEDGLRAQVHNIESQTGLSMRAWTERIRAQGLQKHRDIVAWLKAEHGMTHGNANRVALIALESKEGVPATPEAAIDGLYEGKKAALRPIHDRVMEVVGGFGDFEVAPKKGYLSLRRRKQFAMLQPAATHVDLGLILPGMPSGGRLEAGGSFNAMFSHRLRLSSPGDVDGQVAGWLRMAYDAAG
jgi:hypothetical protein